MCEALSLLERCLALIFSKFQVLDTYTTNGIVLCFRCSAFWHVCTSIDSWMLFAFCMHKRKFKLNQINRIIQQNGLCAADFEAEN